MFSLTFPNLLAESYYCIAVAHKLVKLNEKLACIFRTFNRFTSLLIHTLTKKKTKPIQNHVNMITLVSKQKILLVVFQTLEKMFVIFRQH